MKHDPRSCDAMICAMENARDAGMAETVTLAELDNWAEGYVLENLARCTCRPSLPVKRCTVHRAFEAGNCPSCGTARVIGGAR